MLPFLTALSLSKGSVKLYHVKAIFNFFHLNLKHVENKMLHPGFALNLVASWSL